MYNNRKKHEMSIYDFCKEYEGKKGYFPLISKIADTCNLHDNTVQSILMKLVKEKKIIKYGRGKYMVAKQRKIMIKYFADIDRIEKIQKGNWIDLRAAETVELKKGDFKQIKLGVGMKLPEGFEAHVAPRSSTFKNFGIIQANHFGIIDNSYSGDNDEWMFPAIAMRDTIIRKNDRICQFRIVESQPDVLFVEVDHLDQNSRGGFGSTGIK